MQSSNGRYQNPLNRSSSTCTDLKSSKSPDILKTCLWYNSLHCYNLCLFILHLKQQVATSTSEELAGCSLLLASIIALFLMPPECLLRLQMIGIQGMPITKSLSVRFNQKPALVFNVSVEDNIFVITEAKGKKNK